MNNEDVRFILEAVEHRWAYKFRGNKGSFWLLKDKTELPPGEVGFTPAELAELQASSPDAFETALKAKMFLMGSIVVTVQPSKKDEVTFGEKLKKQNSIDDLW